MENIFTQVVIDQKQELELIDVSKLVSRNNEHKIDLNSKLAQIVIGVRRSGKSTLCHKVLKQNKINYAYLNFDDERLEKATAEDLNDVLSALYIVYGDFKHLFLDEIQNVESWHLFVNRLMRLGIKLLITGSNAKLLSSELSSHLTGRYIQIELFPFSFKEYLDFKKINPKAISTKDVAMREKAYQDYIIHGGFPELFTSRIQADSYIKTLFQSIVYKDILQRFNIKYIKAFGDIAQWALQNFSREISYARLSNLFGVKSIHTVQNYVSYLEQGYLMLTLSKFSFKSHERIRNNKSYIIDASFVTYHNDKLSSSDDGWLLENIVYLELRRLQNDEPSDLYFYKTTYEIDFVKLINGKVKQLIQVCYQMDHPKTRKREINALLKASKELNCSELFIISRYTRETYDQDGVKIEIIPIIDWLCSV